MNLDKGDNVANGDQIGKFYRQEYHSDPRMYWKIKDNFG